MITYVGERGTLNITNGSGTTQVITIASNATVENTIVLIFSTRDTSTAGVSVADSKGNTWIIDKGPLNQSNDFVFIASTRQNTATLQTNDTVTITFGTAPNQPRMAILEEFSGLVTSSYLDQTANNQAAGGITSSLSTGTTATTTQADEVVITGFCTEDAALTHDANYSDFTTWTMDALGDTDGFHKHLAGQYKILSATGTQSSTITSASNVSYQGLIVTYKASVVTTKTLAALGVG